MTIMYDIMSEEEQFIDSFIPSQVEALRLLRKYRIRYPTAYLVKVVRTRCREQYRHPAKKGG